MGSSAIDSTVDNGVVLEILLGCLPPPWSYVDILNRFAGDQNNAEIGLERLSSP